MYLFGVNKYNRLWMICVYRFCSLKTYRLKLLVFEFFIWMVQDPEDISTKFGCTMSQGIVMRFTLIDLKVVIVFHGAFFTCHIEGCPYKRISKKFVSSFGHSGCFRTPCTRLSDLWIQTCISYQFLWG